MHNSQPWRFRLYNGAIEVLADPSRQLAVADSAGWAVRIAGGAATFNERLALAHDGLPADVTLLPRGAAILIADQLSFATFIGRVEIGFALITLALGVIAMAFATTVFGQLLLGVFVMGILLTWACNCWTTPAIRLVPQPVARTPPRKASSRTPGPAADWSPRHDGNLRPYAVVLSRWQWISTGPPALPDRT